MLAAVRLRLAVLGLNPVFLDARARKADTESTALSLREMKAWLEEVDFTARVRNGLFQTDGFDGVLHLVGGSS